MSRYRLAPTAAQHAAPRGHCAHARHVWNVAAEQQPWWRPGRTAAPRYLEQCGQLTRARADHPWLRAGSQMVQQQVLRDFAGAMASFFARSGSPGRGNREPLSVCTRHGGTGAPAAAGAARVDRTWYYG